MSVNDRLTINYDVSKEHIPDKIGPLINATVECYAGHHDNLRAVYIIGSVALGEWVEGVSDLDVIGIVDGEVSIEADALRRKHLLEIGEALSLVTFIDNAIISKQAIENNRDVPIIEGHIFKLAISGICVWGEETDFRQYLESVQRVAHQRTARAEALMNKYRADNLIEEFRRDPRLLTRSCAKAAMRTLSGITLLRGARFHASAFQTASEVDIFAPEAIALKNEAMAIINNPSLVPPKVAMQLADRAIFLFRELFPLDTTGGGNIEA